jgi:probable phosphoglycerate mutase
MQLILVRHGLPFAEPPRVGIRADPSLTPQGLVQAQRLVDALDGEDVDAVVASPAARARETAAPLARARGLDVRVERGVEEYDGIGHGYVPIHLAISRRDPDGLAIASGELPRYVAAARFRERVVVALDALVRAHPGRRNVVVVCHGGVINAYLAHVLGISRGMSFPLDYVGVSRVLAGRDGRRRVVSVNELQHVRDVLIPDDDWESSGRRAIS